MGRRLALVRGARRGWRGTVPWLAFRRTASSLIALALVVSVLGTCPCALGSADACSATQDHAGQSAACCERSSPAPGLHSARCCDGPAKGDTRAVTPTLGVQGPVSILDLGPGGPAPVLAVSAFFTGVSLPPLVRVGGPPVLRI